MVGIERTARDWFQEAARCYVENHQGCAWCGGSHRVYHQRQHTEVIYFCTGCDFRASHDHATGRYSSLPGEDDSSAKKRKTMFEI